MESQHRGERARDVRRLGVRIRNRDADLLQTWLVGLGVFARQHEELGSRFWHRWALSFHPFAHLLSFRRWPRSEQLSDGYDLVEAMGRGIDRGPKGAQVC